MFISYLFSHFFVLFFYAGKLKVIILFDKCGRFCKLQLTHTVAADKCEEVETICQSVSNYFQVTVAFRINIPYF